MSRVVSIFLTFEVFFLHALQRLTIYSGNGARIAPISVFYIKNTELKWMRAYYPNPIYRLASTWLYRVRGFLGVYIGAYSRVSAQAPVIIPILLPPEVNGGEGVEKVSRLDVAALTKKGAIFHSCIADSKANKVSGVERRARGLHLARLVSLPPG